MCVYVLSFPVSILSASQTKPKTVADVNRKWLCWFVVVTVRRTARVAAGPGVITEESAAPVGNVAVASCHPRLVLVETGEYGAMQGVIQYNHKRSLSSAQYIDVH